MSTLQQSAHSVNQSVSHCSEAHAYQPIPVVVSRSYKSEPWHVRSEQFPTFDAFARDLMARGFLEVPDKTYAEMISPMAFAGHRRLKSATACYMGVLDIDHDYDASKLLQVLEGFQQAQIAYLAHSTHSPGGFRVWFPLSRPIGVQNGEWRAVRAQLQSCQAQLALEQVHVCGECLGGRLAEAPRQVAVKPG